ncbi:precorrin-2 C20-methyltransferase/precorrin-3B C17-methyltransferase [Nonomuraea dietziae]|uniref:Precorrin-2 C20-methyltransferase/precorrin-3B C17-methyltransferase n=1 Tax=Nonomuraea dietziae TaxID=65515 RepID=A0A7W5V5X5_9ACTN|nr:precorrin-2 C20-methyltransferase/precorrin-3B C17-methyltransferase [Nonomuraea dietziae]
MNTVAGRLYGVGLGPGDPELVTVKAARLVGQADVIAYHSARHGRSIARSIALPYMREGQAEELLKYPLTTESTDHPGGYQGALDDFYAECADRLAAHLDAGRDVVVLCEGDPLFYGSYMHMHKRLAHRYETEVVPGVTSVAGAAAVLGRPLVEHEETLTVLPGTLPAEVIAEKLRSADSVAVLKLGRTFEKVRDALAEAGRLDEAWYVERATTANQRIERLKDVDPASVPYFSLAMLPSGSRRADLPALSADGTRDEPRLSAGRDETSGLSAGRDGTSGLSAGRDETSGLSAGRDETSGLSTGRDEGRGEGDWAGVAVVGLGPAGEQWLTPEARQVLAEATDLVGYGPYVDRVPQRPGQIRHRTDNRVEAERAAHALSLAREGRRVAVVSSGDPGVFAMASAVLEAAEDFPGVPVRIVPGLTAAHAVASRAGAPLGHDYCVVSLSDLLKPWEVVADRLRAAARADLVLAIYNPASRSRTWQVGAARDLVMEHRDPATPVVIGRDVGGPQETITVTTLGELDPSQVDMRCLLIIGSSTTRATDGGTVYTPRRYPA